MICMITNDQNNLNSIIIGNDILYTWSANQHNGPHFQSLRQQIKQWMISGTGLQSLILTTVLQWGHTGLLTSHWTRHSWQHIAFSQQGETTGLQGMETCLQIKQVNISTNFSLLSDGKGFPLIPSIIFFNTMSNLVICSTTIWVESLGIRLSISDVGGKGT